MKRDRAFGGVGKKRHHIHLLVEGSPARDIELNAELVVEHGCEGGLAETRGAVEEDMGQGFAALPRGGEADLEPLGDGALADDFGKSLRAKLPRSRGSAGRDSVGFPGGGSSFLGVPWIVGSRIGGILCVWC